MVKIELHDGPVDCTPAQAGYNPDKLGQLDGLFQRCIENKRLQCASYILSRHGKVFAHRAMGPLRPDTDSRPLRPDSLRRIASITKMFTATGIMKLVEDGALRLDQSVASVIKEFDTGLHREISIFHLLTHTSGLIAPDPGMFFEPYPREWKFPIKNEEEKSDFIKDFITGPPLRRPGTEWAYCSAGFCLLGEIITRVSGLPFDQYIAKTFLEPLGMTRSFFKLPENLRDEVCLVEGDLKYFSEPPLPEYLSFLSAGGGLYSTLSDMERFGRMLLYGGELDGVRVLGKRTVEAMRTNHLQGVYSEAWGNITSNQEYGLGFALHDYGLASDGSFGHEGAGRSKLLIDPAEEFVCVFFVPTMIDWVPESIQQPVPVIWSGIL
jgi:CubicO group peptidase (beta-lactamase class C family)